MSKDQIIENVKLKIAEVLGNDTSGHDLWHIKRVVALAKTIGTIEGGDLYI